jgi:hypothetical protein
MGYYSEITGLSMKYFLLLWVCSAINGSCMLPPLQSSQLFNSHYECVKSGYLEGLQMVQAMGREIIEEQRLFVAFNCKPETSI